MTIVRNKINDFGCHNMHQFIEILALFILAAVLSNTASATVPAAGRADRTSFAPAYSRAVKDYDIPDSEILRHDNKKLKLAEALNDGRPLLINFVFASCSGICPMLSHTFRQVQTELDKEKQSFHLVSFSIDPENDTPEVLRDYAKKFKAGANWDFYTGNLATINAIQHAFNVFRGDKMNHSSVILIRSAPDKAWLRLEGFAGPDDVEREFYERLKSDKLLKN